MTADDPQFQAAVSELANALQIATPAAARLRQHLDQQAQDADALEAALERAMRAIRELQPGTHGQTGQTP